jgi:hypothetical protein
MATKAEIEEAVRRMQRELDTLSERVAADPELTKAFGLGNTAHTTITRDPNYTGYHAWNIVKHADKTATLSCSCGLDRTFSSNTVAKQALRIHMA